MANQTSQDDNILRLSEESDDEGNNSDGIDDEKAYTLAVIVNTEMMYNEVAEMWRANAESV